ncbi:MAG TPA: hypothetical protein VIM56_14060 [Rhizomicrobium sp.]
MRISTSIRAKLTTPQTELQSIVRWRGSAEEYRRLDAITRQKPLQQNNLQSVSPAEVIGIEPAVYADRKSAYQPIVNNADGKRTKGEGDHSRGVTTHKSPDAFQANPLLPGL